MIIDSSDIPSNRTYKHPLLLNSGKKPDGNGGFQSAPLRSWTIAFCAEYKAIQANPGSIGLSVSPPDPTIFVFDAEPLIAAVPTINSVRMLEFVSQSDLWTTMQLPGDPLQRTGAQAWAGERQVHPEWQTTPTLQLDGSKFASVPTTNREVMTWWYGVCQRAQDAIMNHCAYSVIRDPVLGWGPTVDVCNYDDMKADGAMDETGWMQQQAQEIDLSCTRSGPTTPTSLFHRVNLHKSDGGPLWPVTLDAGVQNPPVWLGLMTANSGNLDSPYLYSLSGSSLDGRCYALVPGHRQLNYYKLENGTRPFETNFETTLRVNRHTTESAINSGAGQNQNRLAPWIGMAFTNEATPQDPNFLDDVEARAHLAMLRAKRIRQAIYWTNYYRNREEELSVPNLYEAWYQTQRVAHQVYALRVKSYARTTGPVCAPPNTCSYSAFDTSRLEYTLRTEGDAVAGWKSYEVEVKPIVKIIPGNPTRYLAETGLVVDFEWKDDDLLAENFNVWDLNIEASVTHAGFTGEIWVWNPGVGMYQAFTTTNNIPNNTYEFHAPVSADGRYRTRVALSSVLANNIVSTEVSNGQTWHRTRLLLKHKSISTVPTAYLNMMSRYDLVQLMPVEYQFEPFEMMSLARSDLNGDGVVDSVDLDEFIGYWLDEAPMADTDANNIVDEADISDYVDAYVSGT